MKFKTPRQILTSYDSNRLVPLLAVFEGVGNGTHVLTLCLDSFASVIHHLFTTTTRPVSNDQK
jgi:hypothetical protein